MTREMMGMKGRLTGKALQLAMNQVLADSFQRWNETFDGGEGNTIIETKTTNMNNKTKALKLLDILKNLIQDDNVESAQVVAETLNLGLDEYFYENAPKTNNYFTSDLPKEARILNVED